MNHIKWGEEYNTCILLPNKNLQASAIEQTYFANGLDKDKCIAFDVDYGGKKKPSKAIQKEYLAELLPILANLGVEHLFVCDGEYFKTLSKKTKAEPYFGYVGQCAIEGFEHMTVTLGLNHSRLFYNPDLIGKLQLSIDAFNQHCEGTYEEIGSNVIHGAVYPDTLETIKIFLDSLHQYPVITCDIEAFSLKHYDAGIGTIAFAWDEHNGGAFSVDYVSITPEKRPSWCTKDKRDKLKLHYGEQVRNEPIRALIKQFFEEYKGTVIYHNITYDAYILTYQLWMKDLIDVHGLLVGLDVMTRKFEDSQLITYLATNSCAGNKLSLKDQAHEFLGNYGQDNINDIRQIEETALLKYNLLDCLGTWFVIDKHYHTVVLDEQLDIYQNRFKKYVKDIIQMQLTGLCLDMNQVLIAEKQMLKERKACMKVFNTKPIMRSFIHQKRMDEVHEYNTTRVKKRITLEDATYEFNPNSPNQVQELLYEVMGLPVIDLTDTKQPAVGGKTIEKLIKMVRTDNKDVKEILQALYDFSKVDKILSSFIPAFKNAPLAPDGMYYLYGSFKLGGTKSGRLSSSNVNLQQLPSTGSPYAKIIKRCFVAPPGWIFVGADYASLEDRIDALLTKDPNKIKVYTDGYDGHSLRAFNYFPDAYAGIEETPEAINGTKKTHAKWRQDSKAPTFALTYNGTYVTLMANCGFTEVEAKSIETNYMRMYQVSIMWKADKIDQASIDGYVTVAFGLRLRTPLLKQVIRGSRYTPFEAEAEGRTANNALGQSYGLLNSQAGNDVMEAVRTEQYRHDIRPAAHIHDAQYYFVKDDLETLKYLNDKVGTAMSWQELPEIWHEEVKLSGELDIFYPTWADDTTLKNHISVDEIKETILKEVRKRKEK